MPRLKLTIFKSHRAWTKLPNQIVDNLMPTLRDTELRILLVVLRYTVGWNRPDSAVIISYRDLKAKTGRESAAIRNALVSLSSRGLIHMSGSRFVRKPKHRASDCEEQYKQKEI